MTESRRITHRHALAALAALVPIAAAAAPVSASPEAGTMIVHEDPRCGCCAAWAERMEEAGFTVDQRPTTDMSAVKQRLGVPGDLVSCHTAEIDGYVLEGHVPLAAIEALLSQRPDVAGLAVPGMPVGSPGMETPGFAPEPYEVVVFGEDGRSVLGTFVGGTRRDD